MLGMAIRGRERDLWRRKPEVKVYFHITKRRWVGIDWDIRRLEIVSGRREGSEFLLAQRNRRHNLLEDNPSSD